MDVIIRNTDLPVQLTPQELADLWWSMTDNEQVEFFNRLGEIVSKDKLESQLISLISGFDSKDKGLRFLNNFNELFNENK